IKPIATKTATSTATTAADPNREVILEGCAKDAVSKRALVGANKRRRSTANSLADWYLSSRVFSKHFRMISSSLGDNEELCCAGGTGRFSRISAIRAVETFSWKGRWPVAIS